MDTGDRTDIADRLSGAESELPCDLECVVIVASCERERDTCEELISKRRLSGLYPPTLRFLVECGPPGGRIGSGGSIVHALARAGGQGARTPKRVLVVDATEGPRAMPCYAPEGLLFAPVPMPSSSATPPVVLDGILSAFLRYPWRQREIVATPGDAVVVWDGSFRGGERGDVCGFAFQAGLHEAHRRGPFRLDVARQPAVGDYDTIQAEYPWADAGQSGAKGSPQDSGIVSFAGRGSIALQRLAGSRLDDGLTVAEAVAQGRLRFDLDLRVLAASTEESSAEDYVARVSRLSSCSASLLRAIYNSFRAVNFRAVVARRAVLLDFGTIRRLPESCLNLARREVSPFYQPHDAELEPQIDGQVVVDSSIDVTVSAAMPSSPVYVESCERLRLNSAGGWNVLLGLCDMSIGDLPTGICLDARETDRREFLLAYGLCDTWTPQPELHQVVYCGTPLDRWLHDRSIRSGELFGSGGGGPWDLAAARLFVPGAGLQWTRGVWDAAVVDDEWRRVFRRSPRLTIAEVNEASSARRREEGRERIRRKLLRASILSGDGWRSVSANDFAAAIEAEDITALGRLCESTDDELLAMYRRKLMRRVLPDGGRNHADRVLSIDFVRPASSPVIARGVKQDQIVCARSPVRLDIAGGWTDTPPYTLREGGEVVNVAVNLNCQPPIQVFCRSTQDRCISLRSVDLGVSERITSFAALEDFANPGSAFALPKAAFCLIGLTRQKTRAADLAEALDRLGCGLELTVLCAVPKGSGLGTSSILGGAILGALHRFFGRELVADHLHRMVLQMEQMLTTGGGWQDQIGGLVGGVKYIRSAPGRTPDPIVHQLDSGLFTEPRSLNCFSLFYTGTTRLAKGILQEVVDRSNEMSPGFLYVLRSLKTLASRAREAFALRSLPALAAVLDGSWSANKLIHPSTSNEGVEAMFSGLRGLYAGAKLLGAGGGGYALFLSESPAQADALRDLLCRRYEDDRARVVALAMNGDGLQVTVS